MCCMVSLCFRCHVIQWTCFITNGVAVATHEFLALFDHWSQWEGELCMIPIGQTSLGTVFTSFDHVNIAKVLLYFHWEKPVKNLCYQYHLEFICYVEMRSTSSPVSERLTWVPVSPRSTWVIVLPGSTQVKRNSDQVKSCPGHLSCYIEIFTF